MRWTRVLITDVSHAPEELYDQVPFVVELLRQLPGADRTDYWLGTVVLPLEWWVDGEERSVRHVVLAARHAGQHIGPGARQIAVNIALVSDATLLEDCSLDPSTYGWIAVGSCEGLQPLRDQMRQDSR